MSPRSMWPGYTVTNLRIMALPLAANWSCREQSGTGRRGARGIERGLPVRASMQLHVRLGATGNEAGDGVEQHLRRPVQRQLVHLVEGLVHEAGEQALDEQIATHELAHQIADGGIVPEGNERAEIAVVPLGERLPGEAPRQLPGEVGGLLMRSLRARRHRVVMAGPWTGGAIADGEDGIIARGLQRATHDELAEPIGLEPADVAQDVGRL